MNNILEQISVDIILPNYNSSSYIEETLVSVINQTFKNWKLFIVDDNSDNKTKDILRKYNSNNKIKIIWLKKNKGVAFCRNLALRYSSSNYLAFIDSDDIWYQEKLSDQLIFMIKNNYKFSYTYYEIFRNTLKSIKKVIKPPEKFNFDSFIKNTSIATSTMIIKKDIVGNKGKLLTENLKVIIKFYNENPLSVELPNQITCKIESTDVALKGQTVSSSYKPAILENGLKIQVPPFIESEDIVVVDTRTIEYIKKK